MELSKDFKEFLELLNVHKVRYLIVGGYAVNFHGYPRYTKDIDLWIWLKRENLTSLLNALQEFGISADSLSESDLYEKSNIIQLGYEPHRIDLLMDVDGIDFESCFENRKAVTLEDIEINFLSIDDLIIAKKSMCRLQDLADAEQLEKIRKKGAAR
ncbi:MAG: nucleotidyltransferase [Imperialibacter sp.]